MSEYVLKLKRAAPSAAPYFKEPGGSFFMHFNVAHPRQAKKFVNLTEVLFYTSSWSDKMKLKFVARPFVAELADFNKNKKQLQLT
jgi:hypothetical protein